MSKERMHFEDLRALLAAQLTPMSVGGFTDENLLCGITAADYLIAELARTAKPEAPKEDPSRPFRVGDRVRIKNSPYNGVNGCEGEIIPLPKHPQKGGTYRGTINVMTFDERKQELTYLPDELELLVAAVPNAEAPKENVPRLFQNGDRVDDLGSSRTGVVGPAKAGYDFTVVWDDDKDKYPWGYQYPFESLEMSLSKDSKDEAAPRPIGFGDMVEGIGLNSGVRRCGKFLGFDTSGDGMIIDPDDKVQPWCVKRDTIRLLKTAENPEALAKSLVGILESAKENNLRQAFKLAESEARVRELEDEVARLQASILVWQNRAIK